MLTTLVQDTCEQFGYLFLNQYVLNQYVFLNAIFLFEVVLWATSFLCLSGTRL